MDLKALKKLTEDLSFEIVGAMPASELAETRERLAERKAAGEEVEFEAKELECRVNPFLTDEVARTILAVGLPLLSPGKPQNPNPMRGSVSVFALGEDYHTSFNREVAIFMERLDVNGINGTIQVDTGPLLERAFAREAGAGFQGKNTTLIHPRWGSMFFIGLVLIDVEVQMELEPVEDGCKGCTLCQKACPTHALDRPYRMMVSRCLSYWTQAKGHVPFEIREVWGDRIYGCDQCQQVCPWNQVRIKEKADPDAGRPLLIEIAEMNKAEFHKRFAHTAAGWRGRNILRRNALLALARPACREGFERVVKLLSDPSPMVRAYAGWTLVRMDRTRGIELVNAAIRQEKDAFVREEWTLVLGGKSFAKMTEL